MLRKVLFVVLSLSSMPAFSASLYCYTSPSEEWYGPKFKLSASVDEGYLAGKELVELRQLGVTAAESKTFAVLAKDDAYRPRTIQNRNRFNFDLNATQDSETEHAFDGIIHGVILPKVLGPKDVIVRADGKLGFYAQVASSTDSYHDGITTYFRMSCAISR